MKSILEEEEERNKILRLEKKLTVLGMGEGREGYDDTFASLEEGIL